MGFNQDWHFARKSWVVERGKRGWRCMWRKDYRDYSWNFDWAGRRGMLKGTRVNEWLGSMDFSLRRLKNFWSCAIIEINRKDTEKVFVSKYSQYLITQSVKNLPEMQETQVQFLGREDPLEKEMAIQSSILAWKISWTEEPGGLQSTGSQESDRT